MVAVLRIAIVVLLLSACGDDGNPVDAGPTEDATSEDATGNSSDGAAGTACGAESCDPLTQICVVKGPVGPTYNYTCMTVPTGCEQDRSCACVAATFCTGAFDTCSDGQVANTVTCDCPTCQ